MNKYLIAGTLLLSGFVAQAQTNKEPYLTKSFDKGAVKELYVTTAGGFIEVQGTDAAEARVEVYVTGNNGNQKLSKEEITSMLEKYELNVGLEGSKLSATAKNKEKIKDWKKALSISFKAFVPATLTSKLNTSGGSIAISKLEGGKHNFTTSGGSIHVNQVNSTVEGRTSGGSIDVQESGGDIDLATSGGGINAKLCKGELKLTTSGGSIVLEQLKGKIGVATSGGSIGADQIKGDLIANTSGGSIDMKNLACNLEATTSGGNINVAFLNLEKYVRLHNSAGNVHVELPKGKGVEFNLSGSKVKTGKLENFNGKIDDEDVTGKLNGGGTLVHVRTSSGRISVDFK